MNTPSIFKKPVVLDQLNTRNAGTLLDALGIRITEVGADFLRGTLPVDERTRQPFGLLHGGASVALAETLGSLAGWLCRPDDGSNVVGIEINACARAWSPARPGHCIWVAAPRSGKSASRTTRAPWCASRG
jgi:1,4-dihydroxy-2-naphthoyl-CoA hydrolase